MCEGQELFFKCILLVADHIDSEDHTLHLHSPVYGEDLLMLVP